MAPPRSFSMGVEAGCVLETAKQAARRGIACCHHLRPQGSLHRCMCTGRWSIYWIYGCIGEEMFIKDDASKRQRILDTAVYSVAQLS